MALIEFIDYLRVHHYEKVGFVETDVVDEPDCHEVNMAYYL